MRAIIQRVKKASVEVDNSIVSSINEGLVVLLGIENEDNENDMFFFLGLQKLCVLFAPAQAHDTHTHTSFSLLLKSENV